MALKLPAEWEPQDGILLAWPHPDTDWYPVLEQAEKVFEDIVYPTCKFCNSKLVYKFGTGHKKQPKFLCRGCGRQFTEETSGKRKPNKNSTGALIGEYWKGKVK